MIENKKIYETIIIGGGPAGATAAVYGARKKLNTLVLTKDWGGGSTVSDTIENWTGEIEIKGKDLAKKIEEQVKHYISDTFEVKEFQEVKSIEKNEEKNEEGKDIFKITTLFGEEFLTESVLIATGGKRRKLPAKGADIFEHKGLTYCASCDGPVFTGKDVVVVGGGNSAFESASQLMAYCKSVTILNRGPEFRAEPTMVESVLKNENVKTILNAETTEVFGDEFVKGLKYTDRESGEEKELAVEGIFVEIGSIPATEFIQEGLVKKNNFKEIIVNHLTMETSQKGIWAAGDCNDGIYRQNGVAIGDGVKAIENLYGYLKA